MKQPNTIVIRDNIKSNWQWYALIWFMLLIILLLSTCNGVDGIKERWNAEMCRYCTGEITRIDTVYQDTARVIYMPHYGFAE